MPPCLGSILRLEIDYLVWNTTIRYRHNFTQLSFISDLLHSLVYLKMHLVQAFAALSYLVIAGMTGNLCYWADVQCESGSRSSLPSENQYCVNNKSMYIS